jgi:hypothetical protein
MLVKYIHYCSSVVLKCLYSEGHSLLLPLERSRTAMSSIRGSYIPLFLLRARAETDVSQVPALTAQGTVTHYNVANKFMSMTPLFPPQKFARLRVNSPGPSDRSPAEIVGSNPTGGHGFLSVVECCVMSGRNISGELISRPEESNWLWWVVVCDIETLWMRRPWPTGVLSRQKGRNNRVVKGIWKFKNSLISNAMSFSLILTAVGQLGFLGCKCDRR